MTSSSQLVLLLVGLMSTKMTFARREVSFEWLNSTVGTTSQRLVCAKTVMLDDSAIGAKLEPVSKHCEALQLSWFDKMDFVPGYEYMIKWAIQDTFDPANVDNYYSLIIPGRLQVGSRIICVAYLSSGWNRLELSLLDSTTKSVSDVYSFNTEKILYLGKLSENVNHIEQNTYNGAWGLAQFSPYSVLSDNLHYLDIHVMDVGYKLHVDTVAMDDVTYIAEPGTARFFEISGPMYLSSVGVTFVSVGGNEPYVVPNGL